MLQNSELNPLFHAQSIAIIGVSSEPQKIGSVILKNLRDGGYAGKIFPVNPKYPTLYDLPCFPSLLAIQDNVDCACISIPAEYVKQAVMDAATKKVKSIVIITAGFGEKGAEGKALEKEIAQIAKDANIHILGPNCLGFMNLNDNINLSFAATTPAKGDIALISQSGAICTAMLDIAAKDMLGFSYVISVGNKADLSENQLLSYLLEDTKTNVIGAYLEDVHQGKELVDLYSSTRNAKPLIVIKPGTSEAGKKAIGSHTGAITGSTITFKTALAQKGIIEAQTLEEFYSLLQCFSLCKPLTGANIVIVTNAGGPGILTTDAVSAAGLNLATISEQTKATLKGMLPAEASVLNPIDILGDARADRFEKALTVLNADGNVDGILVIITPQYVTEVEKTCEIIAAISKQTSKTIIPILLGNYVIEQGKTVLRNQHCAFTTEIATAVNTLAKMNYYQQHKNNIQIVPQQSKVQAKPMGSKQTIVSTAETITLAAKYAILQPEQILCTDIQTALTWSTMRYPVVLKVPTEVSAHKTEVKGVYLHLNNDDDFKKAWQALRKSFPKDVPLLLQQQLDFEEEFFIGASQDESFGNLMVIGRGGIYTQEFNDYGYILLPASRQEILQALAKTTISKILVGARGKKALPVDKLLKTIEQFQTLLLEHPEIVSLDVNPLLIMKDTVCAVDVKIYQATSA